MNEFVSSRVVIFDAVLLPEGLIRRQLFVCRRLHQAAVLHKFLHVHVNFTVDFSLLQYRLWSGGPSSDFTIFAERSVLALLYRLARLGLRLALPVDLSNFFSTSATDSASILSACESAWPAPALRLTFVGVEKAGSGGALHSLSSGRQGIGNRLTSTSKLESKN